MLQQRQHLLDQDNKLDDVIGVVQATKFEAQNFGSEAKLQNKMMDRLNEDIDKVDSNMIRVEGKMKNLIKQTKVCHLYCCLFIEFAILLVLIFFTIF